MRRAIASATALFPLAVGPKRPITTGSGCGGDELGTAERRRGGRVDLDRDELSSGRSAGEVDGRVPSRAATQEARISPARALDEHLLDPPDTLGVAGGRRTLDDVDQALDPLLLDLLRHLVGKHSSFGSRARREDERECAVVADLLDDLDRLEEVRLRL